MLHIGGETNGTGNDLIGKVSKSLPSKTLFLSLLQNTVSTSVENDILHRWLTDVEWDVVES